MRAGRIIRMTAFACVFSQVAGPSYAAEADKIATGQALAIQLCSSCHQVTPEQRQPVRVYNPRNREEKLALSFREIAMRNGRDARFVERILDEPHFPMRRSVFRDAEKQALIAYIQSLRLTPK